MYVLYISDYKRILGYLMKKIFSVSQRGIFFGALSVTVISVILRTLSMLLFFDTDVGYYSIGAVLPVISNIFLAVGVVGFLALAIWAFGKKDQEIVCEKPSPLQAVGAVLGFCMSLFVAASTLQAAFAGDRFSSLCSALAFTGSLYFPCAYFRLGTVWKFITGFSLIARITCMMGVYYFNQNVTMNAPDKTIFCIASIFGMWIVACEIKALMGVVRPWIFITAATCASAICSTASLPSIIKFHADKDFLGAGYAEYWLLFALSIYALGALCSYSVKAVNTENVEADHTEDNGTTLENDIIEAIEDNETKDDAPENENT